MNGEEARRRLFEYIDGELDEADERAFLARFSDDEELAQLYRREKAIEETCARAAREESEMPDELWGRLTDAIRSEAAAQAEATARAKAAADADAAARAAAAAPAPAPAAPHPVPIARPRRLSALPGMLAVGAVAAASVALFLLAPVPVATRARDMLQLAQTKHAAAARSLPPSVGVERAAQVLGIPVSELQLPERTRVNGHPVQRLAIECPGDRPCVIVYYTCCGKPVTGMILRKESRLGQQLRRQLPRDRARLADESPRTLSVVYGDHGRQEIAMVLNDL